MDITTSTYDKFLKFRAVIIQAIALAWEDPKYKKRLIEAPKEALKEAFNYNFPFDMNMTIDVDNATWKPLLNAGWVVHIPNTLELVLPPKPDNKGLSPREEVLNQARALAAYNVTHLTFLTDSKN